MKYKNIVKMPKIDKKTGNFVCEPINYQDPLIYKKDKEVRMYDRRKSKRNTSKTV